MVACRLNITNPAEAADRAGRDRDLAGDAGGDGDLGLERDGRSGTDASRVGADRLWTDHRDVGIARQDLVRGSHRGLVAGPVNGGDRERVLTRCRRVDGSADEDGPAARREARGAGVVARVRRGCGLAEREAGAVRGRRDRCGRWLGVGRSELHHDRRRGVQAGDGGEDAARHHRNRRHVVAQGGGHSPAGTEARIECAGTGQVGDRHLVRVGVGAEHDEAAGAITRHHEAEGEAERVTR